MHAYIQIHGLRYHYLGQLPLETMSLGTMLLVSHVEKGVTIHMHVVPLEA